MVSERVRVMSYNVRSLRDEPSAVAAVIRAVRPDVVCVQEAPRFLRWRSRCAALARRSDLRMACGGREAGANLILVGLRAHVLGHKEVLLPKMARRHQRGVALAVLQIGAARLAVAGTHLSLAPTERLAQAQLVVDLLAGLGEPHMLLGADVNDVPGSPAWTALTVGMRDAHTAGALGQATFPAAAPTRRIDALFVSPAVTVAAHGVPTDLATRFSRASDHRPVVADLLVP